MLVWSSLIACSAPRTEPPAGVEVARSALTLSQANVFGFEDRTQWQSSAALSSSTTRTQGSASLGVQARGYTEVTSVALPSLTGVTGMLALDVLLPGAQPNPYWLGAVQMYVSVPSKGVYNEYLGQQELTGRPLNQFFTLSYSLSAATTGKLAAGGYSDFTVKIAVNVPVNATGTYLLDNLRFVGGQAGGCGDFVEGDILSRWTWAASDAPPATTTLSVLGAADAVRGQQALRAVTTSGFDFWLRYTPAQAIDASASNELRVAVRGRNTNSAGWQGNFPVIFVEDTAGARVRFEPTSQLLSTDGVSWRVATVPLAGGPGWLSSGGPVNLHAVSAVEIHADTWDSGFTLDVDALSFERTGTVCDCAVSCGNRGVCNQSTLSCDCNLGFAGSGCAACADGFVLQNGGCVLANDGASSLWPNAFSVANSDPWLAVHHDQVSLVKPNLLALLYANPGTAADETALVQQVANGFAEGSKTQGFRNAGAAAQLQYQIKVVDLRDGVNGRPPPPVGFPFQNSTLFPRKTEPDGSMRFDYAGLFRASYAPNLGFPDPAHPGQFLDLCTLVNQGAVNELWVVGSGDVPDAAALEVGGTMQNYTASGNKIPGSFSRCANGCVDDDVPFCGRTIRIGFVNYNRGPGCFLHSKGHDVESGFEISVPSLGEWFRPFARFDLDTRYGLPFSNFYGLGCASPPCISYPSPTHGHFLFQGATAFDVDPFDPVCGSVHFPPNGVQDYDYFDAAVQVQSSCSGFGRHAGPAGADVSALIGGSAALPWNTTAFAQFGDCGGEFLVWWYQNMPGQASGQTFADGRKMKSIWPYMFY
jgi:hypothetical protein